MSAELKIIDLGCMNGWGANKPAEFKQHVAQCGDDITVRVLGRCYEEQTCNQCGIRFTVDSSD
jgi:hypothetical protein